RSIWPPSEASAGYRLAGHQIRIVSGTGVAALVACAVGRTALLPVMRPGGSLAVGTGEVGWDVGCTTPALQAVKKTVSMTGASELTYLVLAFGTIFFVGSRVHQFI